MSEKAKEQVVSTQCLAHRIFLELCNPKPVVWPTRKYCHPFITACMYTLEEHVEWLAEGIQLVLGTIYKLSLLVLILHTQHIIS